MCERQLHPLAPFAPLSELAVPELLAISNRPWPLLMLLMSVI